MKRIGFSTGFNYREIRSGSREVIEICRNISRDAIELNFISEKVSESRMLTPGALAPFDYVSLHTPCIDIRYRDNRQTRELLRQIQELRRRLKVEAVVVHPDLVDDWEVFQDFDLGLAVENMDNRKKFGKTITDLARVIEKIDCDFVLDVNHAFSNDPTMDLAKELIQEFRPRLREVHVSGYKKYHERLFDTKQFEILEVLADIDAPLIIESMCKNTKEAMEEHELIKEYFKGQTERRPYGDN